MGEIPSFEAISVDRVFYDELYRKLLGLELGQSDARP